MRHYVLFAAFITFVGVSGNTPSLAEIANRLSSTALYSADATYEVLLPSMSDPVVYSVRLGNEKSEKPDSLLGFDYLISWQLHDREGGDGFAAYFDGNLFRYRDHRLAEYHATANPAPFAPGGDTSKGVQATTQFVDLLPQSIARFLGQIADDSQSEYNLTEKNGQLQIQGIQRAAGYDARIFKYILDGETFELLKSEIINNPDQISEQTVTVSYLPASDVTLVPHSETDLADRYPDIFATYREGTYALSQLPGHALPRITAMTVDGARYVRQRGPSEDGLPLVVAFIDPAVGNTAQMLGEVRSALRTVPSPVRLLCVVETNDPSQVQGLGLKESADVNLLTGSADLRRRCGVTAFPSLVFVGADGIVSDVLAGVNNQLRDVVISKTLSTKQQ